MDCTWRRAPAVLELATRTSNFHIATRASWMHHHLVIGEHTWPHASHDCDNAVNQTTEPTLCDSRKFAHLERCCLDLFHPLNQWLWGTLPPQAGTLHQLHWHASADMPSAGCN
mmetsp:Transcript_30991/g.51371  ORF Transcript_30991/g.51371 Transcript_30991/m.51371 type:complete len:113 (+) Transcript_30991:220-558(+)